MMNETNDWLEILIGKLVDGEISPAERKILERELDTNTQARELLEQLRSLRQYSCQAVAAEVSGGASADQVFDRAWQEHTRSSYRQIFRINGRLRFAAGLAAGLILGLALHFVAVWGDSGAPIPAPRDRQVAVGSTGETGGQMVSSVAGRQAPRPLTREVDWYVFTGPNGEQWLVEGVREGLVKTADYRGAPRPM
jgi:anti-sigma factor RsiW